MREERRRDLIAATRRLKHCETALETARENFAKQLYFVVENDGCSLGEVAKTLNQIGRPMTRQRVHQILSNIRED